MEIIRRVATEGVDNSIVYFSNGSVVINGRYGPGDEDLVLIRLSEIGISAQWENRA